MERCLVERLQHKLLILHDKNTCTLANDFSPPSLPTLPRSLKARHFVLSDSQTLFLKTPSMVAIPTVLGITESDKRIFTKPRALCDVVSLHRAAQIRME